MLAIRKWRGGAKKKTQGNVRRRKEIRLLRSAINFMMVVLRAEREKEEGREGKGEWKMMERKIRKKTWCDTIKRKIRRIFYTRCVVLIV